MDTAPDTEYPGPPLSHRDGFRLVELQSIRGDDPLTIRLVAYRLSRAPAFEAVSYVWGDKRQPESIAVLTAEAPPGSGDSDDVGRRATMPVTASCAAALLRLRHAHEVRRLWIDAVCIHQQNVPERNRQLALMSSIYGAARRVIVHLGAPEPATDAALDWIAELDVPDDFGARPGSRDPPPKPDPAMLAALLARPWFSRVWVLQEVRHARKVLVVCGEREVAWEAFCALRYWADNTRSWTVQLPHIVNLAVSPIATKPPRNPDLVKRLLPLSRRLLQTLERTRELGATDARDKLYAILPLLAWDEHEFRRVNSSGGEDGVVCPDPKGFGVPSADYAAPVARVFALIGRALIDAVGLQVLNNVVTPASVPGLPSWAPDWGRGVAHPFRGQSRRAQRYLYKLSNETNWTIESRSRSPDNTPLVKTWRFIEYGTGADDAAHSTALRLRGSTALGTISKLGDMCDIYADRFPLKQWERLVDPAYLKGADEPYPAADAGYGARKAWERASVSPFRRALAGGNIVYPSALRRAVRLIRSFTEDHNRTPPGEGSSGETATSLKDVLRGLPVSYEDQAEAIFYTCHGKRFFVTDADHIGLAPETSEVGDVVLGFEGTNTLFVARPSKRSEAGARVVSLVGQCYVEGASDPQDGEPIPKAKLEMTEEIEIR